MADRRTSRIVKDAGRAGGGIGLLLAVNKFTRATATILLIEVRRLMEMKFSVLLQPTRGIGHFMMDRIDFGEGILNLHLF